MVLKESSEREMLRLPRSPSIEIQSSFKRILDILTRHLSVLIWTSLIADSARSGDPGLDSSSVGFCPKMEAAINARQRVDKFSVSVS